MANEKRLIDAYKLEDLVRSNSARYHHVDDVIAAIAGQPTVDAVEVVRCKKCKYAEKDEIHQVSLKCTRFRTGSFVHRMRPDDFCSYGERRDGE